MTGEKPYTRSFGFLSITDKGETNPACWSTVYTADRYSVNGSEQEKFNPSHTLPEYTFTITFSFTITFTYAPAKGLSSPC